MKPARQETGKKEEAVLEDINAIPLTNRYIPGIDSEIGMVLQMRLPDEGDALDLNHPFAGKDLVFKIKLMEVLQA